MFFTCGSFNPSDSMRPFRDVVVEDVMTKLGILIPPLVPWVGAALVLIGMKMHLVDPVVAGFAFAALLTFGEAIAYTALARGDSRHRRAYGFIAGAQWLAVIVILALFLEFLGLWTLPPAADAFTLRRLGSIGRHMERLENIAKVTNPSNSTFAKSSNVQLEQR